MAKKDQAPKSRHGLPKRLWRWYLRHLVVLHRGPPPPPPLRRQWPAAAATVPARRMGRRLPERCQSMREPPLGNPLFCPARVVEASGAMHSATASWAAAFSRPNPRPLLAVPSFASTERMPCPTCRYRPHHRPQARSLSVPTHQDRVVGAASLPPQRTAVSEPEVQQRVAVAPDPAAAAAVRLVHGKIMQRLRAQRTCCGAAVDE
mmetsp:Transcript_87519/g.220213  ORF Transcript_87519/g.220213 Transcript_87519/m.220213 type:complete len:205 (-) Transcript_87519:51-665(-)